MAKCQLESEGDEASLQHPKRSKPTNQSQFQPIAVQDPSSAITTILPELLSEILSRLPVKSLLQCRCISKSWLALISSPQFIKTHLRFSANNKEYTHHMLTLSSNRDLDTCLYKYTLKDIPLRSLFHESVTEALDLDYPMKLHRSVSIVGSVNGMICLVIDDYDLFMWNPSIRKYKSLPDFTSASKRADCCPIYGFGYDEFDDDFKVVCIYYLNCSSNPVEVKIYSLKSDSWRNVEDCPSGRALNISGKLVNRKLHWAATSDTTTGTTSLNNLWRDWNIISFDLANKKWGRVEQPFYGEGYTALLLGVLGGDLSVVVT